MPLSKDVGTHDVKFRNLSFINSGVEISHYKHRGACSLDSSEIFDLVPEYLLFNERSSYPPIPKLYFSLSHH